MQTRADKNLLTRMVTKEHIFARAGPSVSDRRSGGADRRMGGGRVAANLLDRMKQFTLHDGHRSGGDSLGLHESLILCMASETISDMISGMTSGTI